MATQPQNRNNAAPPSQKTLPPPPAGSTGNGRVRPVTIKDLLERSKASLAEAAGKWLDADRLLRIATGAVTKNPKLAGCDPMSFLGAILQCAEWGVYPGTG